MLLTSRDACGMYVIQCRDGEGISENSTRSVLGGGLLRVFRRPTWAGRRYRDLVPCATQGIERYVFPLMSFTLRSTHGSLHCAAHFSPPRSPCRAWLSSAGSCPSAAVN